MDRYMLLLKQIFDKLNNYNHALMNDKKREKKLNGRIAKLETELNKNNVKLSRLNKQYSDVLAIDENINLEKTKFKNKVVTILLINILYGFAFGFGSFVADSITRLFTGSCNFDWLFYCFQGLLFYGAGSTIAIIVKKVKSNKRIKALEEFRDNNPTWELEDEIDELTAEICKIEESLAKDRDKLSATESRMNYFYKVIEELEHQESNIKVARNVAIESYIIPQVEGVLNQMYQNDKGFADMNSVKDILRRERKNKNDN